MMFEKNKEIWKIMSVRFEVEFDKFLKIKRNCLRLSVKIFS